MDEEKIFQIKKFSTVKKIEDSKLILIDAPEILLYKIH